MKVLIIKANCNMRLLDLEDAKADILNQIQQYGIAVLDSRFTYEFGEIDDVCVEGE